MVKKKSIEKVVEHFNESITEIEDFLSVAKKKFTEKKRISYCYDYAIIWLYREFELLVHQTLVGAINNDVDNTIAAVTGLKFPQHIPAGVSDYLITGGGFFGFRGRSGLIGDLKKYLPENHWLVEIIKDNDYMDSLNRLIALRNFAAHSGEIAKKRALNTVPESAMGSAGSWLKSSNRFKLIVKDLENIAANIKHKAPF